MGCPLLVTRDIGDGPDTEPFSANMFGSSSGTAIRPVTGSSGGRSPSKVAVALHDPVHRRRTPLSLSSPQFNNFTLAQSTLRDAINAPDMSPENSLSV
jgi:hypothetical protein